ncbi:MAG: sigma 54-interacting transcriptional regulator [Thermincolia bacterium]
MPIVSTIQDKCKACYACIRNCPVKAISVLDGQAKVIPERCISCGNCVRVCAQQAKQVVTHLPLVLDMLADKNNFPSPIIAMIAPSFLVSFPGLKYAQLVKALNLLGFTQVHPVTLGVELTLPLYRQLALTQEDTIISSYCPAIVGLIEKHFPVLIPNLAPIFSAVMALAKHLHSFTPQPKVVFIGPCVAKKEEARYEEHPGLLDAVLTFKELKNLLAYNGIDPYSFSSTSTEKEKLPQLFPVSGGLLRNLGLTGKDFQPEVAMVEGQEESLHILEELAQGKVRLKFLDILFCKGCIDGPEVDSPLPFASRKELMVSEARLINLPDKPLVNLDFTRHYRNRQTPSPFPSEKEIKAILAHTYKTKPEDELNCGACGYNTCREKAIAVYRGLAELDMCLPYLLHASRGETEYYKTRLENLTGPRYSLDAIVGKSEAIKEIKKIVARAAPTDSTILILGASGVGKEIFAQAIHNLSLRRNGPFVAINCAALPELLLESELFGYVEGAFTGARKGGKPGKFEIAEGGTIFLDEIGDMPLNMQAKILRVLQEREFQRIGGNITTKINIRVIAATNKNLRELISQGQFRADLFYRLNVISYTIPSLKDRKEDLPLLIDFIIHRLSREKHMAPKVFSEEAMNLLLAYDWPGNVRELENIVERGLYIADTNIVHQEHLPVYIANLKRPVTSDTQIPYIKKAVRELEYQLILRALKATDNNRQEAAKLLDLPRATFYHRLREFGLL